jgi:hypothetical protein
MGAMFMTSDEFLWDWLQNNVSYCHCRSYENDIAAEQETARADNNAGEVAHKKKLKTQGPTISLLPKWLPRENSSFDKKLNFVVSFAAMVWPDVNAVVNRSCLQTRFRKTAAKLTSYLALPEVLLAMQREEAIQFGRLASKATTTVCSFVRCS